MYKSFSNKNTNLDEVNLNISNSNMFAIMLEQEDGTYKEDTTSTWPTSGYTYNAFAYGRGGELTGGINYIILPASFDEIISYGRQGSTNPA